MPELTGSNHRCRAQFKCAQTVIGQRSAGNGPDGLSYDYYYYYYTTHVGHTAARGQFSDTHVGHTAARG